MKDYNALLLEKMYAEQDAFREELKKLPLKQIIEKAYEYNWRQEILMCVECGELTYERAKALSKMKYPLTACYEEWQDTDCDYLDHLRDCIDNRADFEIKANKSRTDRESR